MLGWLLAATYVQASYEAVARAVAAATLIAIPTRICIYAENILRLRVATIIINLSRWPEHRCAETQLRGCHFTVVVIIVSCLLRVIIDSLRGKRKYIGS